jgi:rubredoxin
MNQYICNKCNIIFSNKQALERHQSKKFKCDIKTQFKCNVCNRSFKQKKNLIEHSINKVCENKVKIVKEVKEEKESNNIIDDNTIIEILINEDDDRIFLLRTIGLNITDDEINKILKSKISNTSKINIIKNTINKLTKDTIKNNSILNSNNNNNNTINNININNFGNENIDYLSTKYFEKLLTNNYGKDSFLKLSNEIYLNKDRPNNNTIKIDNLNNKYCKIVENNKWITTTKESALKKIFSKVSNILLLIMDDDVNGKVPEKRKETIRDYLEKDFDDDNEDLKDTITEFILDIYNFTVNEI